MLVTASLVTRGLDELLQLHEPFCLLLLQYGVCAVKLNSSQCVLS